MAAEDLTLPGKLLAGTYDVMLALPDPAPGLRGDARYAIRPANVDDPARRQQWDAWICAFMLGIQLSVR